jgi:ribonuclease HI
MPYPRPKSLFSERENASRENPPDHYLIAHSDGGARGNPGPAGYGVVIQDQSGRKVAHLSEYLGHQTNNFAEYQGLIAALEYALQHGPKALKLISDSELLVRQIKGIYKVKNPTLQDLHGRAKELIAQLEWFSIGHALREHNTEADRLANEAMDKGMGRSVATDRVGRALLPANLDRGKHTEGKAGSMYSEASAATTAEVATAANPTPQELEGIVRNGVVELINGKLPEGTRVQVRPKKP